MKTGVATDLLVIGVIVATLAQGVFAAGLVLALLYLRLFRRLSVVAMPEEPVDDHGVRFGSRWFERDDRVTFFEGEGEPPLREIDIEPTLDGFVLPLPARESGLPSWTESLGMLVAFVTIAAAVAWWVLPDPRMLPFVLRQIAVLGPAGLGLFVLEQSLHLGLETEVKVEGRKLTWNGASFLLGQPGFRVHRDVGGLELMDENQRLVVRGPAPHLARLAEVLADWTPEEDGEVEVPEDLVRLRAGRTEREG